MAAGIVIAHRYLPCFLPFSDKLGPNFARTLMSSEVALCTCLPVSAAPPPPFLERRFLGSSHHSPYRCRLLGGLFTIRPQACSVPVRVGGRIMMEARWMVQGSCLVRCPQSEILDEDRMNPFWQGGTKEGECRVAGAGCI